MYVSANAPGTTTTHLYTYNPFTGIQQTDQGAISNQSTSNFGMNAIAMQNNGQLYGMETGLSDGSTNLIQINTGNAAGTRVGNAGITTYYDNPGSATQPNFTAANAGIQFDAMAYVYVNGPTSTPLLFAVGHRATQNSLTNGVPNNEVDNLFYELNPATGSSSGFVISNVAAPNFNNPMAPDAVARGLGAGENITGLAAIGTTLYAVTDAGNLYKVLYTNPSSGNYNPNGVTFTLITTSNPIQDPTTGQPIAFHGLTNGPVNVENGAYANDLFATSDSGRLYAFSVAGDLQQIFHDPADANANDRDFSVTLPNVNGNSQYSLAFSTLDYNLWHVTNTNADPNQGINVSADQSRNALSPNKPPASGDSFYFGLEPHSNSGNTPQNALPVSANNYASATYNNGTTPYNTYNLPGGAYGSLTTNTFDLSGYNAGEKPALYFDYYLDAGGEYSVKNTAPRPFSSARVFVSPDNGQTWELVATNDTALAGAPNPNLDTSTQAPAYWSTSENTGSGDPRQQVQPLWDAVTTSTGWRQAHIDLSAYAGNSNLELRFDFSTSGTTYNPSSPGNYAQGKDDKNATLNTLGFDNSFGANYDNLSMSTAARAGIGQNLSHGGWYVDDIVIGFAGQGEMVTNANKLGGAANTGYFSVPTNPDPNAIKPIPGGAYELEIRRGAEFGANVNDIDPDVGLYAAFSINDRLSTSFSLNTDFTQTLVPFLNHDSASWSFSNLAPTTDGQGVLSLSMNVQMTADGQLPTALSQPSKLEVRIPDIGFDEYITVNDPLVSQPQGQRVTAHYTLTAAQMQTLTSLGSFDVRVDAVSNVDDEGLPSSNAASYKGPGYGLGIVSASATLDYTPFANGQQFMIDDGQHRQTFEFTTQPVQPGAGLADGNVAVPYSTGNTTPKTIAQAILNAINAVYNPATFNVSASLTGTGNANVVGIIDLFGAKNVVNGGPLAGAYGGS